MLDIENPDYTRFPKFKEVTRVEGQLLPGDVLYIPGEKITLSIFCLLEKKYTE